MGINADLDPFFHRFFMNDPLWAFHVSEKVRQRKRQRTPKHYLRHISVYSIDNGFLLQLTFFVDIRATIQITQGFGPC